MVEYLTGLDFVIPRTPTNPRGRCTQRGTRAPTTGQLDSAFDESTNLTFELGHKRAFADGLGTFDISVFHTEAKDEQVVSYDFTTFQLNIDNADVRSSGLEIDTNYQLTDRLSIAGAVGYTDAVFTSDNAAAGISKGNRVPNVSAWSVGLNGTYVAPVSVFGNGGDWVTYASLIYRSKREADVANLLTLDEYTPSHLSYLFRKTYGISPSDIRD
ncbi:MAG: TonB-dependent receptor domain-containing protein [Paracoccus sp. (in: a-proteobacteria)]